jgi:HAD superfamily hydrolase (TIGR01484 family)
MEPDETLLASDMDGTLIPAERDPTHREAIEHFGREVASHPALRLVYVTGRRLDSALRGIQSFGLPTPESLACDVGTSVYHRTDDGFQPDVEFREAMEAALGAASADEIRRLLAEVPGLTLQPDVDQTTFKASFDFQIERRAEVVGIVTERLADRTVAVVVSLDPLGGVGLLDVLPAGVAKNTAVDWLSERAGVDRSGLLYAGDSGNDLAAMLDGHRVTVVANADEEMRSTLRLEAERRGVLDAIYFARRPFAAGVLEGCRHWGVFPGQ